MFKGKDDVMRAVELKTMNGTLQRAVQHLYPLELNCDAVSSNDDNGEDINDHQSKTSKATVKRRSARNASAIARIKIGDQADLQENEPVIA